MSILEHIARSQRQAAQFAPKSPAEFFALRLAHKLADQPAAAHYAELVARYPRSQLLAALRRALRHACASGDLGRRFHAELRQRPAGRDCEPAGVKLGAFKIERRCVAAAIFNGDALDYTQVRELSSIQERAQASASGFVRWLLDTFGIESAAIEAVRAGSDIRRAVLSETVVEVLRSEAVPLWPVSKADLLRAYGTRPLACRRQLRAIITGMWPLLRTGRAQTQVADAVALGLFVQTERYFL